MRFARTYAVAVLSLLLAFPVFAQQTATPSTQALSLLQSSLAALTGGKPIADVTLSGTARRIAGSDDDSGPATFKAIFAGAARGDISLSSGSRSELVNLTASIPAGSWSGPDGVSHAIVFHNLLTEPSWFFPAFAISRRLSSATFVATYVGQETHNGQLVQHVSVSQVAPFPDSPGAPTFAHLTQVDFYLDAATLLPAAIAFNIHPDNNSLLDIPVEIRFSGYQAFGTVQVPMHVQKFLNNTLLLDFQASSVSLNSGLSASTFNAL